MSGALYQGFRKCAFSLKTGTHYAAGVNFYIYSCTLWDLPLTFKNGLSWLRFYSISFILATRLTSNATQQKKDRKSFSALHGCASAPTALTSLHQFISEWHTDSLHPVYPLTQHFHFTAFCPQGGQTSEVHQFIIPTVLNPTAFRHFQRPLFILLKRIDPVIPIAYWPTHPPAPGWEVHSLTFFMEYPQLMVAHLL